MVNNMYEVAQEIDSGKAYLNNVNDSNKVVEHCQKSREANVGPDSQYHHVLVVQCTGTGTR